MEKRIKKKDWLILYKNNEDELILYVRNIFIKANK